MQAMLSPNPPIPTLQAPTAAPTLDLTAFFRNAQTVTSIAVSTQSVATESARHATFDSKASAVALVQTALPLTPDTAQGTPVFAPTGTPFIPVTVSLTPTLIPVLFPTALPNPALRSFEIRGAGDGGVVRFPFDIGVVDFTRNPVNPNQYMTVTTAGTLVFVPDFAGGFATRIYAAPFTDFTYQVADRASNNAAVDLAHWSPDGSLLAYVVNGNTEYLDGVWLWSPDPSLGDFGQYVRDCPPEPGCLTVAYRENPSQWESRDVIWSPDSRAFLVRLWLPIEGRFAYMIAEVTQPNPARREPRWNAYYYEYAHWALGSGSILVSGRRGADQTQVGIWRIDRATRMETLIYQSAGLWLQDAVDLDTSNQRIAFLGATSEVAPLTMFLWENGSVRALTPPIGLGRAERVEWNPDRTAALLVIPEIYNDIFYKRYYIAGIDGSVREITVEVAGALAVEWVR